MLISDATKVESLIGKKNSPIINQISDHQLKCLDCNIFRLVITFLLHQKLRFSLYSEDYLDQKGLDGSVTSNAQINIIFGEHTK